MTIKKSKTVFSESLEVELSLEGFKSIFENLKEEEKNYICGGRDLSNMVVVETLAEVFEKGSCSESSKVVLNRLLTDSMKDTLREILKEESLS